MNTHNTFPKFINTISSSKTVLLKITLTLLLPLSLLSLLLLSISTRLSGRTTRAIFILLSPDFPETFIDAGYVTFLLFLLSPSTSSLIYTIGYSYSNPNKQPTYKRAIRAIPKTCLRLILTFLSYISVLVLYTILAIFIIFVISYLARDRMGHDMAFALVILAIFFTTWFLGAIYISIVWQLASVISVLEDGFGFRAMARSMKLTIQGKKGVLIVLVYGVLDLVLFWTLVMFQRYVVIDEYSKGVVGKAVFGVVLVVVLCGVVLVGIWVQTLVYFVCKSCDFKDADNCGLCGHLDALAGEYVAIVSKEEEGVLMEQV